MSCPLVHIIESDPGLALATAFLIESTGRRTRVHVADDAFLDGLSAAERGCILVDLDLRIRAGPLNRELAARGIDWPLIFLTDRSDLPLVVQAMREGASDVIEKPYSDEELVGALERIEAKTLVRPKRATDGLTLGLLSERERAVLDRLVAGKAHKQIAWELGISPRTVEMHRARLKSKLGARTLPDLVRAAQVRDATVPV